MEVFIREILKIWNLKERDLWLIRKEINMREFGKMGKWMDMEKYFIILVTNMKEWWKIIILMEKVNSLLDKELLLKGNSKIMDLKMLLFIIRIKISTSARLVKEWDMVKVSWLKRMALFLKENLKKIHLYLELISLMMAYNILADFKITSQMLKYFKQKSFILMELNIVDF